MESTQDRSSFQFSKIPPFSKKHDFIWLLSTAVLILLIPITVGLSIKGKEIRSGRAQVAYLNNDARDVCPFVGGVWGEFPNSCVDSCILVTNPDIVCLQVISQGCDCGPDSCWNGTECVPNPISFPTKTPSVTPPYRATPTSYLPSVTISPRPTSLLPSITLTPIPYIVADANADGLVNGFDYVIWFVNFGRYTAQRALEGDFDGNGKVDGLDFVLWWQNFGR